MAQEKDGSASEKEKHLTQLHRPECTENSFGLDTECVSLPFQVGRQNVGQQLLHKVSGESVIPQNMPGLLHSMVHSAPSLNSICS